jgi:hypothetical protein
MSELVLGKDIAVCSHTIDRYGRTVAIVYVDGIDAGLLLLQLHPRFLRSIESRHPAIVLYCEDDRTRRC